MCSSQHVLSPNVSVKFGLPLQTSFRPLINRFFLTDSHSQIVKMMIVVVLIFSICWLPYHVYFLVVHHYPEITNWEYIQPLYLSIYFLGELAPLLSQHSISLLRHSHVQQHVQPHHLLLDERPVSAMLMQAATAGGVMDLRAAAAILLSLELKHPAVTLFLHPVCRQQISSRIQEGFLLCLHAWCHHSAQSGVALQSKDALQLHRNDGRDAGSRERRQRVRPQDADRETKQRGLA